MRARKLFSSDDSPKKHNFQTMEGTSNTTTATATSTATATTTKKGGRSSGSTNWKDDETMALLEATDKEAACGSKQWELVAVHLFTCGYNRNAEACKKKFERLYKTEKPTGCATPPRFVLKAQEVQQKIMKHESMGSSNSNDSGDDSSPIKGTNLLDENGELRRPLTKKRKTDQIAESLKLLSESSKEAASTLASAITKLGSNGSSPEVQELTGRMDKMENKAESILSKLDVIVNVLKTQN